MLKLKYLIIIMWMRTKHRLLMRCSRRYRRKYEIDVAVNFGIEIDRLYRLAEKEEIGIDFKEAVFQMTSDEYERSLCLGPFTPPSAFKAHLYFANIRQWINIERSNYNKRIADEGLHDDLLPMLSNDVKIHFGVTNSEGNIYLVGWETKDVFHVAPAPLNLEEKG